MIGLDALVTQIPRLQHEDLKRWILNHWVRPDQLEDGYLFHDIDVARVRLILELRDELEVNEDAMPVVLSLLDQLYSLRRRLRQLTATPDDALPEDVRNVLTSALGPTDDGSTPQKAVSGSEGPRR